MLWHSAWTFSFAFHLHKRTPYAPPSFGIHFIAPVSHHLLGPSWRQPCTHVLGSFCCRSPDQQCPDNKSLGCLQWILCPNLHHLWFFEIVKWNKVQEQELKNTHMQYGINNLAERGDYINKEQDYIHAFILADRQYY